MISFKNFLLKLNESFFNRHKIYINPTIDQIKAIAKNSKYEAARFVLNSDGDLKVGDADNSTHHDIEPAGRSHRMIGFVNHHNGQYHYKAKINSFADYPPVSPDHPILERFKKRGITDGHGNE